MDVDVDHYRVLGLPSGEEGAKLTEKEISKAYKLKALELHPDKRPDDLNAHDNFQKLKSSYEILRDENARKLFDDLLKIKRVKQKRQSQQDGKRQKMMLDLEKREMAMFAPDPAVKARQEEERVARQLKEEIERIRAMHANQGARAASTLDKEKVLKVLWEKKVGEDYTYTAERLREIFSEFGKVEDVVIRSSKKKGSALVVMATKDAVGSASASACGGSLSDPLLVLPLQLPAVATEIPSASQPAETESVHNLVGAGFQAYERFGLEKLQKKL